MSKSFATLLLLTTFVALGCSGSAPTEEVAEPSTEPKSARVAPEFTLPKVGGGDVSLADGMGNIRLVDFWATWCAPCREEIPMLNELQAAYGDRGFEILAITSEDESLVTEFLEEHGVQYTNLLAPDDNLAEEYGAVGLPTGFLIDREGRVYDVFFGAKPRSVLIKKIEELLATS